ncbi:Sodium/potassium/calcium exchanger 3 [Lamellibrachia satsuma]|nr:Sodium/potassium/calcium exchanger 3 [Lamellibrachia satsuma]
MLNELDVRQPDISSGEGFIPCSSLHIDPSAEHFLTAQCCLVVVPRVRLQAFISLLFRVCFGGPRRICPFADQRKTVLDNTSEGKAGMRETRRRWLRVLGLNGKRRVLTRWRRRGQVALICVAAFVLTTVYARHSDSSDTYRTETSGASGRRLLMSSNSTSTNHLAEWERCDFEKSSLPIAWMFSHFFCISIIFIALALICDDFFVPSLEVISEKLHLSEDVAGATFMAAGSSAPELFTSVAGVAVQTDVGVGTIVGSAVFNLLIIIALTAALAGQVLHLDWRPLMRDSFFYALSIGCFIGFAWDGVFQHYESVTLLVLYAAYIVLMVFNRNLMDWMATWKISSCIKTSVLPTSEEVDDKSANTKQSEGTHDDGKSSLLSQRISHTDVNEAGHIFHHRRGSVATMLGFHQTHHDQLGSFAVTISPGRRSSAMTGESSTTDLQSTTLEMGAVRSNNNSSLRPPPTVDGVVFTPQTGGGDSQQPNGGRLPIAEVEETGNGNVVSDTDQVHAAAAAAASQTDEPKSPEGGAHINAGKQTPLPIIVQPSTNGPKADHANANHYSSQRESSMQKQPHHLDNGATRRSSQHTEGDVKVTVSKTTAQTIETGTTCDDDEGNDTYQLCPCLPCCPVVRGANPPSTEGARQEGGCLEWTKFILRWILFIPSFPFLVLFSWTVPDCSQDHNKKWFILSFLSSVLWIAILSFAMVTLVGRVGCILNIDSYIMGLCIIAVGTSLPDAISSILVARDGFGDMAVSNAIGSNVFDINLGIGLPFIIRIAIDKGAPISLLDDKEWVLFHNGEMAMIPHVKFGFILLLILILALAMFTISGFHLNRSIGVTFVFMYAAFIAYALTQEIYCLLSFVTEREHNSAPSDTIRCRPVRNTVTSQRRRHNDDVTTTTTTS